MVAKTLFILFLLHMCGQHNYNEMHRETNDVHIHTHTYNIHSEQIQLIGMLFMPNFITTQFKVNNWLCCNEFLA